ncbi:MAG: signal peptidase I [Acidimicrobiales bacterium]
MRSELHSTTLGTTLPIGSALRGPIPVPSLDVGEFEAGSESATRSSRWVIEWLVVLTVALLLALGVRTYVAQMFFIPSGSMLPTLQIGDRIVVDKLSYHFEGVQRGDVVVFRRPPLERADYSDLVKRVIGLPGDTVSSVDGRVYIDGKPLSEPWLPDPAPVTSPSPLPYPFSLNRPYTVPAGDYYVMGDNRTDSEDSRYFGPISGSLIVGKMAFVIWPLSDSAWIVILSVVAVVVAVLLVLVLLAPRRALNRRSPPVRGPPGPVSW